MVDTSDIDKIIEKLLESRGKKQASNMNLTETQIKNICIKAREIFLS